ncbi:related to WD repeat-containing protein JIP5 [Melanopsichium pennsylvanicum]|uniref:WD repeat-containing protein JIP5 n=1 Tax=Melanopsichium pennsylvanicum TaxID=63383 RepID=A0AAJ4XRU5_9BASI|nr:related to WD repeat-containing protein JIP5 [Melanopsichium pennsylvanicum]
MDITLSSDALDLSFHPAEQTNLLAIGLISGKVQLINYDAYLAAASSSRVSSVTTRTDSPCKKVRTTDTNATISGLEPTSKLYQKVWVSRPSRKSCRGLNFSHDGEWIYSISKDKGLFKTNVETGKLVDAWVGVHDAAPSRVCPIDDTMVVTGDDDGVVRLWDPRKGGGVGIKAVREWKHHFDWITDMIYLEDLPVKKPDKAKGEGRKSKSQLKKDRKRARQANWLKEQKASQDSKSNINNHDRDKVSDDNSDTDSDDDQNQGSSKSKLGQGSSRLIVTSGDGSLSSIDLRTSGPTSFEQSQDQEDELLSITSLRSNSKLVVGTQLGILSLWNPSRGLLDHVDRVPGHPASVDTLVTLDDQTVLTGSSDGLVRVVQILPSKLLGVIASHDGLPVERMKRKHNVLATIGHSNSVKFTDLTPLLEEEDDDQNDAEEYQGEVRSLGIFGLGADDSDEDEDEEEEQDDDDFAGLMNDQEENDDDDNDDDVAQAQDDNRSDEDELATRRNNNNKSRGKEEFFSDM